MQNNIEVIYDDAISYASFLIRQLKLSWLQPNDIVQDAYIIVYNNKELITSYSLKKAVKNLVYTNRGEVQSVSNEIKYKDTSKFCKSCKEEKPISCFGITTRNKGAKKVVQAYCYECLKIKMKKYRKTGSTRTIINYPENLKTYKQKRAWYMKQYQEKKRDKLNKYAREWAKKKNQISTQS